MKTKVEAFNIIGISVRTTNENGQATKDIPFLWNKFFSETILSQIPSRLSDDIYCIYTDYVKDYTQPYTTIIGCKVANLDTIPGGLIGKSIPGNSYTTVTAKGKLADGIVFKEWQNIWNSDLARAYSSDFEIYKPEALIDENAEVEIFISIK